MDILQWIDTGFQAVAVGFFALIPGMTAWTVILSLFLLIRRIGLGHGQAKAHN